MDKDNASKEVENNISQLQVLERNMQNIMMQRQNFHMQTSELDNALEELDKTKENPFKIVGGIMIQSTKDELKKELSSKREVAELRIKNLEKQEGQLKEKAETLQKSILKELQSKKRE